MESIILRTSWNEWDFDNNSRNFFWAWYVREKKCSNLYLKYVEMKEIFGLYIINEYPIIKTLQQCMGYANMTRLLIGLHTQGSNGTPTARLTIPNWRYWLAGYMNTSTFPKCIIAWRYSLNIKICITTLGRKWMSGQLGSNITTPTIKQPNVPTSSSWMQASQISTINLFHWGDYNWLKLGPPPQYRSRTCNEGVYLIFPCALLNWVINVR